MSFMDRGEKPSININQENSTNNRENNYIGSNYLFGRFYVHVTLDDSYVAMSVILTLIIIIAGIVTYLAVYESKIIDPLEDMKKLFINFHIVIIGILLGLNIVTNFFSKDELILVKRLIAILALSIIMLLIFAGLRLGLDSTYTYDKFAQIYDEQNHSEETDIESKIDIGLSGMSIKTEKEYYVDECVELYNIFKIKTYGILLLHFLLNVLIIYQMIKVIKIQNQKNKLKQNDVVVFDEEQNIRY